VEEAIKKAEVLTEALPYIQKYYDRIVVVKMGGSLMDDPDAERQLLRDVVFMNYVGMQPILVHGGGKEINAAMNEAGIEPLFVEGLRYTDERTLAIAEHVLCGQINKRLVTALQEFGCNAIGLHSLSSCVLFGERMFLEGEDNRRLDIGFVGQVTDVNAHILRLLVQSDTIPVIAPIARDRSGGRLNINADLAAGEVAAALKAEKLVMLSDTHGIRANVKDPKSYFPSLTKPQVQDLVREGVITKGMLPKVQACLRALEAGVGKTHIIDGRFAHSLLLEIFTDKGVGTEILSPDMQPTK
jgi:acetylglutamate kinase